MLRYQTEQRKQLLNFLMQHPHGQFSAKEIADALGRENASISSVYRNLAALVKRGVVRASRKDEGREAYYEYVAAEACRSHLHLRCRQCGATIHLGADVTERLVSSIDKSNCFAIDCAGSVLQGICAACRGGE